MLYISSFISRENGVSIEIDGRGAKAYYVVGKKKSITKFSGGKKWK